MKAPEGPPSYFSRQKRVRDRTPPRRVSACDCFMEPDHMVKVEEPESYSCFFNLRSRAMHASTSN